MAAPSPASSRTFCTARENALTRVQELIVTPDMHERKRLMFERSDAFVALPGGIGTLEELVEQMTWQQLGRHTKPILLANIDGFWEPLLALLDAYARDRVHPPDLERRYSQGRARRGHPAAAARRRGPRAGRHQGDGAGRRAPALAPSIAPSSSLRKRHRLDAVAVGIDDERRVVAHAIMRTQARRAVGRPPALSAAA